MMISQQTESEADTNTNIANKVHLSQEKMPQIQVVVAISWLRRELGRVSFLNWLIN